MDRDTLLQRVADHQPADEDEARHQAAIVALLAGTHAPFSRRTMTPGHITASAFVLSADLDRVLLIHHTVLGRWLQPGGHVEPEDVDIDAACLREVVEETGVWRLERLAGFPDLLDLDVHEIPANPRKGEGPHRHFDVRTLWRAVDERLVHTGEVAAVRWVPLAEAARRADDASVARAIGRIQARLREAGSTAR